MKTTGIYHRPDGVGYLITERFHSVEPLPATAADVRLAIDEALNHLDALHKLLDDCVFREVGKKSNSTIESDRINFPNEQVGNLTNSCSTGNSGRPALQT